MKYSDEIKAVVKAIEHDISYFATGIRLQYHERSQDEVEQDILAELDQRIIKGGGGSKTANVQAPNPKLS